MEIRSIEKLAQDLVGKILVVREGNNEVAKYTIGSIYERYGLQMKDIHDNPIPFGGNDYELELLAQGNTVKWGDMLWEMKDILPVDWEERTWQLARDIFSWSYRCDMDNLEFAGAMADNATEAAHVFMEHYKKYFNNSNN